MALIDKASLLMVPSTYEAGKLYNVLPSGNRAPDSTDQNSGYDQTRADFDFDRGSNASATRVNASGLIEKYRENRVLYSNDFTNAAWIKFYTGVTPGQEDPFGGTNGTRLVSTGIGGYIYQNGVCISSNRMTASFWVKSNTGINQDFVFTANSGNQSSSAITATTSWQRVSFTFSSSSNGDILFGYQTTQLVDLLIYGFQLEAGTIATDYLDSTSVTGKAGVLVDLPRINYDANGENASLLLEPSRANIATLSEYFAGWNNQTNVTINSNYTTSPEGLNNASRLLFTANGYIINIGGPSQSSGTQYTLSCYAKRNDSGTQSFGFFKNGSGAVDSAMSLTNEWQRFDYTYTASNNSQLGLAGSSGADVSVYGFQVEANASYASSYIPTMGTSETRAADSCSVTGASDVIGQTEGTMYAEVDWNVKPESGSPVIGILTLNNGANNLQNSILLGIERQSGGTNRVYCFIINSNVSQSELFGSSITDGVYKIALAYKANDFALYVNGAQIATDTSGSVPALSEVLLGKRFGTDTFNTSDGIKQALLFKERLSNAELATLTTL